MNFTEHSIIRVARFMLAVFACSQFVHTLFSMRHLISLGNFAWSDAALAEFLPGDGWLSI